MPQGTEESKGGRGLPIRLLVAEDFDLLREDLCETLSAQPDMEVVGAAATGRQIAALALKLPFDILLMDIEMETLNAGIQAAEAIIAHLPGAKIIFLTAHETQNMILTAMGAGGVDYVVKGVPDDVLFSHIRAAYAGSPLMEARVHQVIMQEYSRLRKSERSLLFFINNIAKLTPAERELVRHLLSGLKIEEIARLRCVEVVTVKTQIKGLLHKFGCSRTKQVVAMIRELNIEHLF